MTPTRQSGDPGFPNPDLSPKGSCPGLQSAMRELWSGTKYARDPETSWRGIGPIGVAALDGELSAETVSALADGSVGPRASCLPLPKDGDDETIAELNPDIRGAGGKMLTVESTADDWQRGGNAPQGDWPQKRFGANPQAGLVSLAELATREIYAACGLRSGLFGGSNAAGTREAWRLALFGTILPMGRIVETELRSKLDDDVTLGWDELRASDLMGRARAFQSMVAAAWTLTRRHWPCCSPNNYIERRYMANRKAERTDKEVRDTMLAMLRERVADPTKCGDPQVGCRK